MDLGLGNTLLAGDPRLVDHIVGEVKSQGIFDQFRKECIADVDTKPAYQNLRTRVESSVNSFLNKQTWKADLNKNQLRETLRKQIHDAPYLDAGVERIVDQVVNPKVYSVFMPQIEDVVYKFLGLERPKNQHRNGPRGFKDLLPKDLDPVSPESDKNSLRDVSLDSVDANIVNTSATEKEIMSIEKRSKDDSVTDKDQAKNGQHSNDEEQSMDETSKPLSNLPSSAIFNNSAKLEEKIEEEEEDSPMFEPIDIMNLNESNISNDSHLSGISELTSHRSQSPDFSNETSRDNMDFSNHDSQFSKVSSDSRLSIVTDFGSSNHEASTPLSDSLKEDSNKDKNDAKCVKDNFKAVREYETGKVNKDGKLNYEISQMKENIPSDSRAIKRSFSSKETSRDGMENSTKDSRDYKDKTRESESSKSKTTKDRESKDQESRDRESKDRESKDRESKDRESKDRESKDRESKDRESKDRESKDSKRDKEIRKKENNHSGDSKTDKNSKTKIKEKSEPSRESGEKIKEKDASGSRPKEEKIKETEKKDVIKESKDLKDIYKEKIRELREKKELTEKEKLSKDKDTKCCKETKERRDSSRDKRDSKDHKSYSSSRGHNSSRSDGKTVKSGDKDAKSTRSESRDKGKRDERRYSKDHKSKRNSAGQTDLGEKNDGKRLSRSDKDEKSEKSEVKQDSKQKTLSKRDSRSDTSSKNSDSKRESSKSEIDGKDKKRRDEKKNKIKDDHSSLRKNSDDRRSTDRDGSNGSNGKSSQKNNPSSGTSSTKSAATNLSKESTTTSNSSSETSDSIEEKQNEKLKISMEQKNSQIVNSDDNSNEDESHLKRLDIGCNEISLPIKKRPLAAECDVLLKKPKFAKNFQEAKKLMKIRRRMERESMKKQMDNETNHDFGTHEEISMTKVIKNDVLSVPDDERVQIVEFRDEEYDEPYPEVKNDFTIEERSQIILGGESINASDVAASQFNVKSTLSEMEIAIRESLNEMISDKKVEETNEAPKNSQNSLDSAIRINVNYDQETTSLSPIAKKDSPMDQDNSENLRINIETWSVEKEVLESPSNPARIEKTEKKYVEDENCTKEDEISFKVERDVKESTKNVEIAELAEVSKSDKSLEGEIFEEEEETIFLSNEPTISPVVEANRVETSNEEITPTVSTKVEKKMNEETIGEEKINEETILKEESCNITKTQWEKSVSLINEDLNFSDEESPCLYFIENNERLERFTEFMNSLEIDESSGDEHPVVISNSEIVSSVSKTMAPPKPKRKYSTSPLTDILLNNANNNNEAHKIIPSDSEDSANNMKKRKIGRPKKQQRINASLCSQQNLSNGENFVMPLSPESDVSATSEKIPSNPLKDEKSRPRGSNQRYTSDDLYKPRPLFSSSSRRSRRSNQA